MLKTGDFLKKIKNIGKILEGATLVKANVVGLYPGPPYEVGLEPFRKGLNEREAPRVLTEELKKMADVVPKNNFLEFNGEV